MKGAAASHASPFCYRPIIPTKTPQRFLMLALLAVLMIKGKRFEKHDF